MVGSAWRQWWWVFSFCFIAISVYLHFAHEKKAQIEELSSRFGRMQRELGLARAERDSLLLQIESQNDPSWIEMILMRDLGVVPEGWLKVHFAK